MKDHLYLKYSNCNFESATFLVFFFFFFFLEKNIADFIRDLSPFACQNRGTVKLLDCLTSMKFSGGNNSSRFIHSTSI